MTDPAYYFTNILLPELKRFNSDLQRCINKHGLEVQRIASTGARFDSVVSFGCGKGDESIALMLILGAKEVVGVDKDDSRIEQAKRSVRNFQQSIKKLTDLWPNSLRDLKISDDICFALELLHRYENKKLNLPGYQLGDIVQGESSTHLPSNYFDLAYCHYVLYHIYCTDEGISTDNTISAVREMARVVKVGGLIVAIEPEICSPDDNTTVNLHPFFEQVGLQSASISDSRNLTNLGYVYSKVA